MNRKSISLIIGLMSFALIGVMAMQYYFIKESYSLKSQLFDQAVNDALNKVSTKLEKKEAIVFLAQRVEMEDKKNELRERLAQQRNARSKQELKSKKINTYTKKELATIAFVKSMKANQAKSDSIFRFRDSLLRSRYPYKLVYNGPAPVDSNSPFNVNFRIDVEEVTDEFGNIKSLIKQSIIESPSIISDKISKRGSAVVDSIRRYMIIDPVLGTVMQTIPKPNFLTGISEKELRMASQINQVHNQAKKVNLYLDSLDKNGDKTNLLMDIASEMQQVNVPLKKRIHPETIDSLLAIELENKGINLDYNYKISSSVEDSVIFLKASEQNPNFTSDNTYKAALFSKDMLRDAGYLTVTFPKKNSQIINNMNSILISSASLLLILAASFGYTILSILKQKKVSEMKTDFINNMTHEFKTPVATIMIASEALRDPEINENKARVNKLANIIYDENIRLGNHIERVLNIAKIEKDDLKLESKQIDVNDMITTVIDSMSLQLQKKKSEIDLILKANDAKVMADELHLSNVIFNLIDNANKYSNDKPEICISTEIQGNQVVITVSDKGIGMSRDQQKKIFEQFYRIPTGNLHDVKGFGLGLSYVSNMVKRMNGNISVKSEKDKGSEFVISFPLT